MSALRILRRYNWLELFGGISIHLVLHPKVNPTTVRKISFALTTRCECSLSKSWLISIGGIVTALQSLILSIVERPSLDLVEGYQIWVRQLHLRLLALLVRVGAYHFGIVHLQVGGGIGPSSLDHALIHRQSLLSYTFLTVHHKVISGHPEVYKRLLILLNHLLMVVRHFRL